MSGSRSAASSTPSPFITPAEAADYLRLRVSTLASMRVSGMGPAYYKVGHRRRAKVLYRYEDLQVWMDGQRFSSTSEYVRRES